MVDGCRLSELSRFPCVWVRQKGKGEPFCVPERMDMLSGFARADLCPPQIIPSTVPKTVWMILPCPSP